MTREEISEKRDKILIEKYKKQRKYQAYWGLKVETDLNGELLIAIMKTKEVK